MNNYIKLSIKIILICLGFTTFYGCSTQKDNATNRSLQNLSARYNLIYNSNVLLGDYQDELFLNNKDNYDNFLAVYIAPAPTDLAAAPVPNKTLDDITQKAQVIVSEKNFSNYIDEAYILLGKTNFYKGNFFDAVEYFNYVSKTYKKDKNIYLNAMNWKARSLMELHQNDLAISTLDTVKMTLDSVKKGKAEPLATLAQMSIDQRDYGSAAEYLSGAIKETNQTSEKLRWLYILGQLQEYNKNYDESLRNYARVEKSNAAFELYFNAKLSKIRINSLLNKETTDRKQLLLKLLKDDKNLDFTDQIYYEIAENYFANGDDGKAEEYYKLSAQKSTKNANQKGLSYLKIADLKFKNLGDYVNAKLYYDSAANTLPKNYPNYDQILKKSQNLEYLTQRYEEIRLQDALQRIAHLPESERLNSLNSFFEPDQAFAVQAPVVVNTPSTIANVVNPGTFKTESNSTFYFSNTTAISKGYSDFKKKWGNRKLAVNWRQSIKSSLQNNQQSQNVVNDGVGTLPSNPDEAAPAVKNAEDQSKLYIDSLPLTAVRLERSNQKISNAYFEIAGFYQQVLNDQPEAIKTYQTLLERFPKNNNLAAVYYSLHLSYKGIDNAKSTTYKNLVLNEFPSSVYAKTIIDPSFSLKQNALEAAVMTSYNTVFDKYEHKDFPAVIQSVDETNQRFPGNNLEAQFAYLKAIAIGRTQPVDSLIAAFNAIVTKYPKDVFIKPLVTNNLLYINEHLADYKKRKVALLDFDPNETPFVVKSPEIPNQPLTPVQQPVATAPVTPVVSANNPPPVTKEIPKPVENKPVVKTSDLFTTAPSELYYFVIDVVDADISLSSSRFGIGQFNRGNYSGSNLRHQLKDLEEDQLIYVGNFATFNEAKVYAESIKTQLGSIMKVPAKNYITFVISKENFDKLSNKETINKYLSFIKTDEQ